MQLIMPHFRNEKGGGTLVEAERCAEEVEPRTPHFFDFQGTGSGAARPAGAAIIYPFNTVSMLRTCGGASAEMALWTRTRFASESPIGTLVLCAPLVAFRHRSIPLLFGLFVFSFYPLRSVCLYYARHSTRCFLCVWSESIESLPRCQFTTI
jgi:hypothetical protein